jgi:hypothetical protein
MSESSKNLETLWIISNTTDLIASKEFYFALEQGANSLKSLTVEHLTFE